MLYINILVIALVMFALGYILGKGKIEIIKRVEPSKEQKEEMERLQKETQDIIKVYNESLQNLNTF